MNRVLLLSEEEARSILYCAYMGGHKVIVAGNIESNKMLRFHPMAEKFIPLENKLNYPDKSEKLLNEILEIIKKENIDVLLPSSFDCIRIVSFYCKVFEEIVKVVATPKLETIDILDDKNNFFQFCTENNFPHPTSYFLDDLVVIHEKKLPKLNYPIISKPVLGAGEEGLEIFQNEKELYDYYLNRKESERHELPVLLQEFFEGEDIDFNGFAVNGEMKTWSVMRTTSYKKGPSFTMTDFIHNSTIGELGKQIVKQSNFSGPLNIDMRIRDDNGKVELIEVNPRFWARSVYSLMDGINFIDVGIRNALGENYIVESKESKNQWVSSLSLLLGAMIKNHDKESFKFLKNISWIQLRYMLFTKYYLVVTRIKNKFSS